MNYCFFYISSVFVTTFPHVSNSRSYSLIKIANFIIIFLKRIPYWNLLRKYCYKLSNLCCWSPLQMCSELCWHGYV